MYLGILKEQIEGRVALVPKGCKQLLELGINVLLESGAGVEANFRDDDYPDEERSQLRRYAVKLHATVETIHFFEHLRTGRWWMEVPHLSEGRNIKRNRIVPCSYSDYEIACNGELPERWISMQSKVI